MRKATIAAVLLLFLGLFGSPAVAQEDGEASNDEMTDEMTDDTVAEDSEGEDDEADAEESDDTEGDDTEGDDTEGDDTEGDDTEGDDTEGDDEGEEGDATAQVSIVHAVPGQTVDVFVNGDPLMLRLDPLSSVRPVALGEGTYAVELYAAGSDPEADEPIVAADIDVVADTDVTITAHLDEGGDVVLTAFENDVSDLEPGKACLVARHTAAAPAVDILTDGAVGAAGLEPGASTDRLEIDPSSVQVNLAAAGSDEALLGMDAELTLAEGVCTIAYAVGDPESDSLGVIIQLIAGLDGEPEGNIDTGTAGLLGDNGGFSILFAAMIAFALAGGAFATRSLVKR
jgi:flagellin-like hook-associated protein FlgL